jgi:hypothetical protein
MNESDNVELKNYDVFLSYYSVTGKDFVRYLKKGLKEFEINAFLDEVDIPKTVEKETDEWRLHIDESIKNSTNFFLVMTLGFNTRKEVLRELDLAFKNKKRMHFFKHENLASQDLTVELNGKSFDLSKYEYIPFTHENDLVRKAVASLLGKLKQEEKSYVKNEAENIIASQGTDFKRTTEPIVEIVAGPREVGEEWLLPTPENKYLVSCFPHFPNSCEIMARRKFFECSPNERLFLKLRTDGFLHVIQHLIPDRRDMYYIDIIAQKIFGVFAYLMRIMQFLDNKREQSVTIILRNLGGKGVIFTNQMFLERPYSFANQPEIKFSYEFLPADGWKGLGQIFIQIFKDLCLEAGCIDIAVSTIRQRVCNILHDMYELQTEYRGNVVLPRVDIDAFALC